MHRRLHAWLQANGKLPLEKATQVAEQALLEAQASSDARNQDGSGVRLERRELDKTLREQKLEKKSLEKKINQLLLVWKQNPQAHNPIEPDIRKIQVPLTKQVKDGTERKRVTKTRMVIDKNGKEEKYDDYEKVDKYKIVKKSAQEIESEIRLIFQQQMNVYTNLKAMHDETLKAKADTDAQLKTTLAEIEAAEAKLAKWDAENETATSEAKELQLNSRAVTATLNALKSGRPVSAFRPPSFEIIDFAAEEN